MTRRKRAVWFVTVFILLLFLTWAFGRVGVTNYLQQDALRRYAQHKQNMQLMAPAKWQRRINPEGPELEIHWIVPVFPGLLLSKHQFIIGPTYGSGRITLFFWGIWLTMPLSFHELWIS